jgi:hypothetical protein
MIILAAACGTKRSARARAENAAVTVAVQNNNWNTIVVYAISHGLVLRLGEVTTGNTVSLKTPRGMDPTASDFRIRIDPVGSRGTYTTPRIALGLGQTVSLRVENQLNQTSFSVS